MAGGHEVTGLLVGAITNLCIKFQLVTVLSFIQLLQGGSAVGLPNDNIDLRSTLSRERYPKFRILSYLWHSSLTLESPSHSVVDTLRFPPAWVNTFESVALMAVEALSVWIQESMSAFMRDL